MLVTSSSFKTDDDSGDLLGQLSMNTLHTLDPICQWSKLITSLEITLDASNLPFYVPYVVLVNRGRMD